MSLCASLLSAAQREEAVRPYLESPAWEAFVAPGGRRAKQTFVAASTPSGRGRKQELARLNKLNREGPAAPADAGGVQQRTARRRKKLGKRGR